MEKKILHTPLQEDELKKLKTGDIFYLTGEITTCRDVAHRRVVQEGMQLPVNVSHGAILHAGPIVRQKDTEFEMISVGPTTSMRMEKFEKEFIRRTGVRLIVGKGGMGAETAEGCKIYGAVHCVFPAGCAVVAAATVEKIISANWKELGMPETLWTCKVKEFGPLIVSIDASGNNLFEENKKIFNDRMKVTLQRICKEVDFIK